MGWSRKSIVQPHTTVPDICMYRAYAFSAASAITRTAAQGPGSPFSLKNSNPQTLADGSES